MSFTLSSLHEVLLLSTIIKKHIFLNKTFYLAQNCRVDEMTAHKFPFGLFAF